MGKATGYYRDQCARHGWEPGPDQIIFRANIILSETDAQARRAMGAYPAQAAFSLGEGVARALLELDARNIAGEARPASVNRCCRPIRESTMAKGLLVAAFDFSTAHADEFHDWYDLEHIPERRAVPGFGACERWIGEEEPTVSVATYDLDSIDVLRGEVYASNAYGNLSIWSKRVTAMCKRLLRFEGTQITPGEAAAPNGAGGLLLNAMNVAPEAEKDFNAWYDEEHLPALARVPGTLAARRYRSGEATGGTHRYVAIYHLKSPDVTRSKAWMAAVDTPWSARLRPHFRDRVRILTRHYIRVA